MSAEIGKIKIMVFLIVFQKMNLSETFQVGLPPPLTTSNVSHEYQQQLQNNVFSEPTSQGTWKNVQLKPQSSSSCIPWPWGSFGHHRWFHNQFPLHLSLFSTALWDSRAVHSLMLSTHLFLCLPCLLPPFTVPCKMVLARPIEREMWQYHCVSLRW